MQVRAVSRTVATVIPRTIPYTLLPTRYDPRKLCGEVRPYYSDYRPLLTPIQLSASNWELNTTGRWPMQCAFGPDRNKNLWFN